MNKKINKHTLKRLLSYFKHYKISLIIVVICIIISSFISVAGSIFLQILIDDYIKPLLLETNPVFDNLLNLLFKMGFIFLIGILTSYLSSIIMIKVGEGILKKIREDLFSHMQTLSIKYFDSNLNGDIMSIYTNDIDAVESSFTNSFTQFISTIISVFASLVAMIYLSVYMTLIVLITVLFMFIILAKIGKKSGKYFKLNQKSLADINAYIEEMISGTKVVKVFNYEEDVKENFDKLNEKWCYNNTMANKYANTLMPVMGNLSNLQYVIVAIIGGLMAINGVGSITLGIIASFLQLSKSFTQPISRFSQQINSIVLAVAAAERIFKLMDQKSEEDYGFITMVNVKKVNNKLVETKELTNMWAWKKNNEYIPLKGDVRLNHVCFSYVKGKEILHDISLYAKPGQKIAFVGATGAGKTTITNLLSRFYDIDSGEILYDGINIKDIKLSDLRKSLGMVLQDTKLFSGTILENLKYGNSSATLDEVIESAKLANADSFIKRLPDGYNTYITGAESNLSQGQRQLLSIARAAVANPPVMILDEATSSIDTRTEKLVQEGMDKLMKNRTVFVIAHRLSTVENSKAIMVLENGKIIERGEHASLINDRGIYYQLYTGLFELE